MHLACILGVGAFYMGASLVSIFQYLFSSVTLGRLSLKILFYGFCLHTVLLFYTLALNRYPFFTEARYALHFISWGLILAFLLFTRKREIEGAGPFVLVLALALYLLTIVTRENYQLTAGLSSPWLLIHFLFIFTPLSLFLLSFGMGLASLWQSVRLKQQRPPLVRLPSLAILDRIHNRTLEIGWGFLTLGILSGGFLSLETRGRFFSGDPRQWGALIAWLVYLIVLKGRVWDQWRGGKGILLSLIGLLSIGLAFLGTRHG